MHNDIITQNIKLIDEKLIINEKKFEKINGIKYLVFYVSREFEPKICDRCGYCKSVLSQVLINIEEKQ